MIRGKCESCGDDGRGNKKGTVLFSARNQINGLILRVCVICLIQLIKIGWKEHND